jgi:hypothetical protein
MRNQLHCTTVRYDVSKKNMAPQCPLVADENEGEKLEHAVLSRFAQPDQEEEAINWAKSARESNNSDTTLNLETSSWRASWRENQGCRFRQDGTYAGEGTHLTLS